MVNLLLEERQKVVAVSRNPADAVLPGVVRGACGDAVTSPIHERDVAAVGVRARTNHY